LVSIGGGIISCGAAAAGDGLCGIEEGDDGNADSWASEGTDLSGGSAPIAGLGVEFTAVPFREAVNTGGAGWCDPASFHVRRSLLSKRLKKLSWPTFAA